MDTQPNSAAHAFIPMHQLNWSPGEKIAARRAFNLALHRKLDAVLREAKDRAAKITEPSELWDLEDWLTKSRKEIDRTFDYRYSVLPVVFAHLLHQRLIEPEDLNGISQDKLDLIQRASNF